MGADGGSIPDRRDLVKTKGRTEQADKESLKALFFLCALSKVCKFVTTRYASAYKYME